MFTDRFAFDVETTPIDDQRPWEPPEFVIGAAFDGEKGYFIGRQQLCDFLAAHPDQKIIMHHAPFDLAVIEKAVPHARICDRVDRNQVMDTQLLHRLYTLATAGHTAFGKGQATLERCAADYLSVELPKAVKDSHGNDIRTSYGKWLNCSPDEIEPVYLRYLAKDAVVTIWLFQELERLIDDLLAGSTHTWGYVSPDWLAEQVHRWGPLTHHIQLKASIVLNEITRNGLHLDLATRDERLAEVSQVITEHVVRLRKFGYEPGEGSGAKLQEILHRLDHQHADLKLRRTMTGKYKVDRETLADLASQHPFFKTLQGYRETEKLRSAFLGKMDRPVLHPSFDVLKNTGRTSSFGQINAQNLPRDGRVRACFVPSPGCVFIDADYGTVELATLAQACLTQFALPSRMAEAINARKDLHKLVAAQVTGKRPEDVTDVERQQAKPINFGKPGGMGNTALKSYAKASYGVELNDQQVQQFVDTWFGMFPEMRSFLSDDADNGSAVADYFDLTPSGFAEQAGNRAFLRHPDNAGREHEPHRILGLMCIKVMGHIEPQRRNGLPYTEGELDYFWDRLAGRRDDLPREVDDLVTNRRPSPELRKSILRHICRESVFTLTGRLRANATYCARHNTVFQGLAADGAKLGLWLLWRAGYRIANFIHDEVLVEVPETGDLKFHAERIRKLMIDGMTQVVPDVRIDVEYAATRRWYKKAKAVFDSETGALVPWEPRT